MTRRAAATAAAALAAVVAALSGCSTTVAGTARPGTQLKSAALEDAKLAGAEREWVDVTGQGVALPRDTLVGTHYSPVPIPGAAIAHETLDGRARSCTIGPAVADGGRQGFLTAGHCATNAVGEQKLTGSDGLPVRALGAAVEAEFSRGLRDPATGYANDSAVIWTPAGSVAAIIAGTWPVAGVLSVAEVEALPKGAPVCFFGAVSGVACGPLLNSRDPGGVHFGSSAQGGDSGAAVFLVADGAAWLIGIMSSTDDYHPASTAALLAPALDRLHAEAITAR